MSDLISRQAAIDAVGKYLKKDGDVITIADVVDAAVAIGMLPSAEPEQTCEYWDSESKFCALCRPSAQPSVSDCWGCKCPKMERLKKQKTFSEMVHLHDAKRTTEQTTEQI